MTDQIGRADYVLGTDNTGVKTGVAEAEAEILKSGDRTEADVKSRGYRIGQAIGTGIKVVATASSAMFAIAAKGAIELQNVTADYRAETGATAAESERAGKAINAMSGRNIQGIKEIGTALTKVHTDLHLTGDEAEAVTERFLKFARATKQDAAGAVVAFDDILDAWGLTAKDATGIMDKLIVSHQKYGGSIEANQAALARMAPQLKALNLNIDDGIALLNLFAASGLDAADGQKALNAAITKLPAGETLNQFIARLSTIQDDGARAQEAIKVFGTRAGAGLANAIRPGVNSLDAFKISAEEAAGATVKASDAMDSTFSAQVQLKIKAIGAAIIDLGPGITGIASALSLIGPLAGALHLDDILKAAGPALVDAARAAGTKAGDALSDGLQSVWSGAGGTIIGNNIASRVENILDPTKSTVIGNAYRGAAAKAGVIYGAAMAAGSSIATPLAAAIVKLPGAGVVRSAALEAGLILGGAFGGAFGTAASLAMKGGLVIGLAAIAEAAQGPVQDLGTQVHEAIFGKGGDPLSDIGKAWQDWRKNTPWPLGQKDAPDWASLGAQVKDGLNTALVEPMQGTADQAGKAADDIVAALITPLRDNADRVDKAAAGFVRPFGPPLAKGIDAGAAEAVGAITRAGALMGRTLAEPALAKAAHRAGLLAMGAVAQGIEDGRAKPVDAFSNLLELLKHPMSRMGEIAHLAGELTSSELAKGLKSRDPAVRAQAQYTKGLILDRLDELKASAGPLSKKAMAEVEKGLKSKDPDIRAAARAIKNHVADQIKIPNAYSWGQAVTVAWAAGLASTSALEVVRTNAIKAAHTAATFMHGKSPPPEGPLHTIDKGGENVGIAWAEGLIDGVVKGSRGLAPMLAGLMATPGMSPASLKFAPSVASASAMTPAAFAGGGLIDRARAAAAGGGNTYISEHHQHVEVQGLVKARDPFEIATQLRRLNDFRTLTMPPAPLARGASADV